MKTINDMDVKGKIVLMRVDYNVPLKEGKVTDDLRVRASVPTITALLDGGAKRVVLYSGFNESSGHQFVIDGYDGKGFFHVNWGWGGSEDGYFTLATLNPDAKGIGGGPSGNGYPITQVPFTAVKITPNTFWGDRIRAAREVTIPLAFQKCEETHRYENFKMAAYTLQHPGHEGLNTPKWDVAKFMGFSFDDTDVYKTIEGASYVLQTYPDDKLKATS